MTNPEIASRWREWERGKGENNFAGLVRGHWGHTPLFRALLQGLHYLIPLIMICNLNQHCRQNLSFEAIAAATASADKKVTSQNWWRGEKEPRRAFAVSVVAKVQFPSKTKKNNWRGKNETPFFYFSVVWTHCSPVFSLLKNYLSYITPVLTYAQRNEKLLFSGIFSAGGSFSLGKGKVGSVACR